MYETDQDLAGLQELLDWSYARAGEHLRSIWGPESRLDARGVCGELAGIEVLDLATVTPKGEPRVAPVDGLFFRGSFWFGSAENSMRIANIRSNPAVSAVVTRGLETFLVIVHGHAIETDPRGPDGRVREIPTRRLRLRLGRHPPDLTIRTHPAANHARVQAAVAAGQPGPLRLAETSSP
jgi:Pyridoxamine 5'-phosphate oxidase